MSDQVYPHIDIVQLTPLQAVKGLMALDPEYLTRPGCPYSKDVKEFLSLTFAGASVDLGVKGLESPEDLDRELRETYAQLQTLAKTIENLDAKDKVVWLRATTGILERLIDLRARNLNQKHLSEFQSTVLSVLDDLLEPQQRTEFSRRLGKFL